MRQALRQLFEDFLSAILFAAVYWASGSLFLAAGVALAAAAAQLFRLKLRGRPIDTMQWLSLGLVLAFAGATMLTQSPRFLMAKPSVIHFAIAAVMLRRGWMGRYLPEIVRRAVPEPAIAASGFAWAALMAGLGAANLVVAATCDFATWVWFVSVVAVGAKLLALGVQYVVFRGLLRRRLARPA